MESMKACGSVALDESYEPAQRTIRQHTAQLVSQVTEKPTNCTRIQGALLPVIGFAYASHRSVESRRVLIPAPRRPKARSRPSNDGHELQLIRMKGFTDHFSEQVVAPLHVIEPHIERWTFTGIGVRIRSMAMHHILTIRYPSEVPEHEPN